MGGSGRGGGLGVAVGGRSEGPTDGVQRCGAERSGHSTYSWRRSLGTRGMLGAAFGFWLCGGGLLAALVVWTVAVIMFV